MPRRRRAYTEMDDLLENDIIQGGDEALDIVKQESKTKKNSKNNDLNDLNPPFRSASPMQLSGDNTSTNLKRREIKAEDKVKSSLQSSLMRSLGVGFDDLVASRRKYSLDFRHKEKMKTQDLKNILTDKLQAWLSQPNQDMMTRQAALGILPTAKPENKKNAPNKPKKEFISPKKLNPEDKNISPHLQPTINFTNCDEDPNQLRKGSSQILSGAGSMRGAGDFRDRSDSLSAFKKYEKYNNDNISPMTNPMYSPAVHPTAVNQNALTLSGLLGPQQNPMMGGANNMAMFQNQLI